MLKIKEIKKKFKEQGIRASRKIIDKLAEIEEERICKDIEKLAREMKILGRRNMKKDDLRVLE